MQFVAVKQNSASSQEPYIHFLQWTGNERELVYLYHLIRTSQEADNPSTDDYSTFEFDIVLLSEATVNEMIKIVYGNDAKMFQKHNGVYKAPEDEYRDKVTARDVLNKHYHKNGFKNAFYN